MLRSRKRSAVKESAEKSDNNSKMEVSNFLHHLNNEFSFNSPPSLNSGPAVPVQGSMSPSKKKKISTSSALMKQKG